MLHDGVDYDVHVPLFSGKVSMYPSYDPPPAPSNPQSALLNGVDPFFA